MTMRPVAYGHTPLTLTLLSWVFLLITGLRWPLIFFTRLTPNIFKPLIFWGSGGQTQQTDSKRVKKRGFKVIDWAIAATILAGDRDRCELMRIREEDREGQTGGRRAEGRWMEIVGAGEKKRRDRGAAQGYSIIINRPENRCEAHKRKAVRETWWIVNKMDSRLNYYERDNTFWMTEATADASRGGMFLFFHNAGQKKVAWLLLKGRRQMFVCVCS